MPEDSRKHSRGMHFVVPCGRMLRETMSSCPLCDQETSEPLFTLSDRVMCSDCFESLKRIWAYNLGKQVCSNGQRVESDLASSDHAKNEKPKPYPLRCDYCKRIIRANTPNTILCTSCGHGKLHLRKPKNHCDTCGSPIYDNVCPPPVRVTCGSCTQGLILHVSRVARTAGVRLEQRVSKKRRGKYSGKNRPGRYQGSKRLFKEIEEIAELKTGGNRLAELLASIRKAAGLPQRLLAEELKVSSGHLCEMEHGRKPLTLSALRWVKENAPRGLNEADVTP